jgi:hypothetical protein
MSSVSGVVLHTATVRCAQRPDTTGEKTSGAGITRSRALPSTGRARIEVLSVPLSRDPRATRTDGPLLNKNAQIQCLYCSCLPLRAVLVQGVENRAKKKIRDDVDISGG